MQLRSKKVLKYVLKNEVKNFNYAIKTPKHIKKMYNLCY